MITDRRRNLKVTIFLIVISFIGAHLCFWLLPDLFETWNARVVDRLFLFRSSSAHLRPPYDDTIVHVDLNDTTIQQLDNYYLNRSHHAQVIRNLAAMNVSVQLYDLIFAARSNDLEDTALIEAVEAAGNVYFGLAFKLSDEEDPKEEKSRDSKSAHYLHRTKWQVAVKGDPSDFFTGSNALATFTELASASHGLGYLNLKFDRDGVFRRIPLLVRYGGGFHLSFAFQGICNHLGVTPEKITVKPGKNITLKDARRPDGTTGHDIVIPIDRQGNMLINFVGPWGQMKHYNFADVLRASEDRVEMEMWEEELSGKIVLVSEVLTGSADLGPVPTDASFPLSGIHSNVINTILTESFLRELSGREMLMVELSLIIMVLVLSVRLSPLHFSLGTLGVTACYVGVLSVSFLYGNLIFHIIRPLLMIAFALISVVVYRYIKEEKERNFIRATFGRYLSNEVVEELLDSPDGLKMSGESKEVTFLVSDLRGFTALSSRLSPHEVINILNRYLERMVEIIGRYRGTVNEIEGDGILTFFGAPLTGRDDHERAVACAVEMQKAMEGINAEQRRLNLPELAMGVGINSGEVVVGNIGSEMRTKYSAIGSPLNTAFRIESYTVGGQILVSPSIYEKVRSQVRVKGNIEVQFKGIDRPITLYDVVGIEGKYKTSLPDKGSDLLAELDPPLPIHCFSLEDKSVSEKTITGYMTSLGTSSALVSLSEQVQVHSNLKILLAPDEPGVKPEAYAKVVSLDQSGSVSSEFRARLEFTWLPEDTKHFFGKKRT